VENYLYKDNKKLRMGYTTGTCAAAAAKAASIMLFTGAEITQLKLNTPKGITVDLKIEDISVKESTVSCAVRKDSGDDPDVTNGILIYAQVKKVSKNELLKKAENYYSGYSNYEESVKCSLPLILIDGGKGVGRITQKGLSSPVGAAAINKVPREMIFKEVLEVCGEYEYNQALEVLIYIPEGEEKAKKTFNPNLGIIGGISVLGTSGIVEPMSESALIESIKLEMNLRKESNAEYMLAVPGNYGEEFSKRFDKLDFKNSVKCSNYIGETIDYANEIGLKGLLFISHIGKFIKLSGGIMNTHSRYADCRMELIMTAALLAGADNATLKEIMKCITTQQALECIKDEKIKKETLNYIVERINIHLKKRAGELKIGAIVFNEAGILGETENAEELLKLLERKKENNG